MGGRDAAGGSGPGVHGHGSSAQSTMSTAQQSGVQQLGRAGDMGLPAGVARHGGDQQRTTSSERSSHGTSAQGDAQVIIPAENSTADVEKGSGSGSSGAGARRSIYDLYTSRRRNTILLAAAFASILVPFCDTVYLPALAVIQTDLNTGPELVAASVSIYMFVVGIAALVWGPASDRFGRLPTYVVACVAFIGASLGCTFAPSAAVLVLFRALQGAGVAAFMTSGTGIIADVFPPEVRGTASGVYMIPLLIGPVIGPVLGGALSQAFGWRSTFIALTAFAAVAGLLILVLVRRETHQWYVVRKLAARDPERAHALAEWACITARAPTFDAPWVPLRYLLEGAVWPHALVTLVTFATMFGMLTELPAALSEPPYGLTAGIIGVCYLADGIAGLIGSPIGGVLSDKSAAKHPNAPEARLVLNTLIALVLMPAGLLVYGWGLHAKAHLAVVLAGMAVTGFGCAAYLPGLFGYLTTLKQSAAAAAAAAVSAMMFVAAGVVILVSAVATRAMGAGPWFSLLAGLQLLVTGYALAAIVRKQRAAAAAAAADQALPAGVNAASYVTHAGSLVDAAAAGKGVGDSKGVQV